MNRSRPHATLGFALSFCLLTASAGAQQQPIEFDAEDLQHEVLGFGAQIWGYNANPKVDLKRLLSELSITHVRICRESASWEQLKSTWDITQELGIQWVLMTWRAPQRFENQEKLLADPEGFARWWADEVEAFASRGMTVPYIELMNEPDSKGEWSTGIPPRVYNDLVKRVRKQLDDRGFERVGIVGPGLTHFNWNETNRRWFEALDAEAVAVHAAWSSHTWDDGDFGEGGASVLLKQIPTYLDNARTKDERKPVFVTEYATKETTFHGKTYPHADRFGELDDSKVLPYYSVTCSVPYAARVYENTLALLNSGVQVPFLWQLNDEPTEVYGKKKSWGMVDLEGRPKPVYETLRTLLPHIRPGDRVARSSSTGDEPIYSACFVGDDRLVVALANDGPGPARRRLRIRNAQGVSPRVRAIASVPQSYGSVETGEPGKTQVQEQELKARMNKSSGVLVLAVELPKDGTMTLVMERAPRP